MAFLPGGVAQLPLLYRVEWGVPGPQSYERTDRAAHELRPIHITPGYNANAAGSALVRWGNTVVLATVSIENKTAPHLRNVKHADGWLTAEYALLPGSTERRVKRERPFPSGRTQEIQRLIGRSLRAVMNLTPFRGKTIIVDTDVLIADGGTRAAALLAGYAALHNAADKLVLAGTLSEWPLRSEIAAVSVGLVDGVPLTDLDFAEDQRASADITVVATRSGEILEVQGGSEDVPIPAEQYVSLIALGVSGVEQLWLAHAGQLG